MPPDQVKFLYDLHESLTVVYIDVVLQASGKMAVSGYIICQTECAYGWLHSIYRLLDFCEY